MVLENREASQPRTGHARPRPGHAVLMHALMQGEIMRQPGGSKIRNNIGIIAVCTMLLAACSDRAGTMADSGQDPDNSLMRVITGEVWYRERLALPPGAEVIVTLEDQSRADAPAIVITDYTHVVDGPGPFPFRLVYDPSVIDDRMTYGLRARIEEDGELIFSSTEHIDPFVGGPVRILVSRQSR